MVVNLAEKSKAVFLSGKNEPHRHWSAAFQACQIMHHSL